MFFKLFSCVKNEQDIKTLVYFTFTEAQKCITLKLYKSYTKIYISINRFGNMIIGTLNKLTCVSVHAKQKTFHLILVNFCESE